MTTGALYLAELVAFDPDTRTISTLRYASGLGYVTTPSETPASTHYDARIKQAVNVRRSLFSEGKLSGRSKVGYGELVLHNGDGALDALLDYAVEGRAVTVRRGTPDSAYPGGFTTIFSGTMEQVEVRGDTLVVKLRDKQMDLLQPLQPVKYAGSNALPDGLEGVEGDLKGKPKPICLGQVYNAPIPCVNTAKLIYQVADAEIETVDAVYDSGVPLLQGFPLTSRSHGFGSSSIFGLAYGAGLFVAVGRSGILQTSPDTLTWTTRTSGFGSSAILQVAYANGLFVAVGESGTLATSVDGITWTTRTSGFGTTLIKGVAYGAGVWVIVGFAGKLATSSDGITWTLGTSGFGTTNINCVAYGNGRFVIGGIAPLAGAPSYVGTSLDGTTWTVGSTGSTLTDLFCLAYGGGLFIAGGQASFVITSPDGVAWTERDHDLNFSGPGAVYAVAYGTAPDGSALYVAVGTYGTASTSPDGITWTQVTSGVSASNEIFAALLGDGRVVAAGVSGVLASSGAGPTYPTLAALVDDTQAPDPGSFRPYYGPEGTYVRLGASPYGQITADATEGAASANRTTAQLFVKVLQRAGKVTGDWSASDVTALDTAASGACGYWTMEEVDYADALDEIAASPLAWWGANVAGVYRIQQLSAPAGTAALQITANDLAKPLARLAVSDATRGLPSWRTILRYQRNYAVQVGAGGGSTGTSGSGNLAGGGGQDLETNTAVIASGSTVPRTLAERFGEVFNVQDYGAVGDGSTNDRAAILSAIDAAIAAGGGRVVFQSGLSYNLGSTMTTITGDFENIGASLDVHFPIQNADGVTLEGNGCTLISTLTSGAVFLFDGCRDYGAEHFFFQGEYENDVDGYTELTLGALAFVLSSLTRDSWHGTFESIRCDDMFVGVACAGDPANATRVRQVAIRNLTCDTGRYAVQCGENGDEFLIENLHGITCKRTYFVYGVDRHAVDLVASGGRAYNPVLIKAYARDTTNLAIKARINVTSFPSKVSFDSEHTIATQPTPNRIVGVTLDYDDTGCTNNSGTPASAHHGIDFVYHPDGTLSSTSSNQLFDRITIRGIATGTLAHASETPVLQSPVGDGDFSKLYANPTGGGNTVAQAMAAWGFVNTWSGAATLEGRLTAGGLTVSNAANTIGGTAQTDRCLDLGGTPTTGTTQYGAAADYRGSSAATSLIIGEYLRSGTTAAAYTASQVQALRLANPAKGAGSTITTAVGLYIESITQGGTNNYAIQTGTGRHSFGDDIEATGGFAHTVDGWYQDNVVASQTNVALTRAAGRWTAVRAGSVLGVGVHASEARTAGTLTVTVYKNTGLADAAGSSIGLTAVLDGTNTSRAATTQAKDTDTFAAGDELYAVVTTDGSWLPVTSDIRVSILVEC